jgi:acyl carrier protein
MTMDKIGETADAAANLRTRIISMLVAKGHREVDENASLFLGGLLDSLAAAEIISILESDFGLDLMNPDFDIKMIDTLARLDAMASRQIA